MFKTEAAGEYAEQYLVFSKLISNWSPVQYCSFHVNVVINPWIEEGAFIMIPRIVLYA